MYLYLSPERATGLLAVQHSCICHQCCRLIISSAAGWNLRGGEDCLSFRRFIILAIECRNTRLVVCSISQIYRAHSIKVSKVISKNVTSIQEKIGKLTVRFKNIIGLKWLNSSCNFEAYHSTCMSDVAVETKLGSCWGCAHSSGATTTHGTVIYIKYLIISLQFEYCIQLLLAEIRDYSTRLRQLRSFAKTESRE